MIDERNDFFEHADNVADVIQAAEFPPEEEFKSFLLTTSKKDFMSPHIKAPRAGDDSG